MRILIVASEAVPYAKTGGLADVAGALPRALAALGHDVVLLLPLYASVDRAKHGLTRGKVRVEISTDVWREDGWVWSAPIAGTDAPGAGGRAEAWFLENDRLFGRPSLYGEGNEAYPDNAKRFAFFAHVAAQLVRTPPDGRPFEVLHVHDWQAALAPVFLRTIHKGDGPADRIATVLTIHNLAYQGVFPGDDYDITGLPRMHFHWQELEFWGQVNYLKGGLVFADVLSTVSERYAQEILGPELGCGLDGVLSSRKGDLVGILNGVDYEQWSPEEDRHIAARYSADNPSPKEICRNALLREAGLPRGRPLHGAASDPSEVPLVGCVSRLVDQKGFDLIESRLDALLERVRLVILGSGDPGLEGRLLNAARARPDRLAVRIGYDEAFAHRIEAGADFFLMPSRFEPCGLNQIYSLRYGAVPIVRATGGLDDTVVDADEDPADGNGFKFGPYDGDALVATVDRAVAAWRQPDRFARIRENGMRADHGWSRAAEAYVRLYERARAGR